MQSISIKNSIIREAKRIQEDTLWAFAGHWAEARWWGNLHLCLGIPTTIIAAIVGISSVYETQSIANMDIPLNLGIIGGILSFLVAAMSALSTFLDSKGLSAKHFEAGMKYKSLYDEVRIFSEVDCIRIDAEEELDKILKSLNTKLKEIDNQTPMISNRAIWCAGKKVKSGVYDYEIDKKKDDAIK